MTERDGPPQMQVCPKCGGMGGAHYLECVVGRLIERFMGGDYPWRAAVTPLAAGDRLTDEEIATIGQQYAAGATEPLRQEVERLKEQMAHLKTELEAAVDAITAPTPPGLADVLLREEAEALVGDSADAEAYESLGGELDTGIPTPEPEPITWAARVRAIRNSRGWAQRELAEAIGFSRAVVGLWEQGVVKPGKGAQEKIAELENEQEPTPRRGVLHSPEITAHAKEVMGQVAHQYEPDPDGWVAVPDLLAAAQQIDAGFSPRLVGMGMSALGYTEKRQFRVDSGGAPVHYRGLKPKAEPSLEEQMEQRRAAEAAAQAALNGNGNGKKPAAKERYRYDGPRPGGEIPKEYREMLEPLWETPGWAYAPRNENGGGKPRVIAPNGAKYNLANTPSDHRSILNAKSALRRLGAPIK